MHSTHSPNGTRASADPDRVPLTRARVMTPTEVAELLQMPLSTVYYLARSGQLPHSRLGRSYRFLRDEIETLLRGDRR
jgi:excisionase family DNA binding protein